MELWNKPPIVFTSDYHYLIQNMQKKGGLTQKLTDEGAAAKQHIDTIQAFWKVKVKAIVESFASEASLVFIVEVQGAVDKVLESAHEYIQFIQDPPEVKTQRIKMEQRKKLLEEVLEMFRNVGI